MPKLKKYAFPPLEEVAFEITFLPKLKVIDKISDFQDTIARSYPHISIEELFTTIGPMEVQQLKDRAALRYTFENAEKTSVLRVSVRNFNYVDKKYDSFAVFAKDVLDLWDKFTTEMGPPVATRAGLRYINKLKIPAGESPVRVSDFTKPYYDSEMLSPSEISSVKVEARIERKGKLLTIRSGILGEESTDKGRFLVYLLDYDCYQECGSEVLDLNELLEPLHSVIEAQFLADVEKPYKEYMEKGDWS